MSEKHQQFGDRLSRGELLDTFPWESYPEMRPNQDLAFTAIAEENGNVIIESPTGSGKTAIEFTFLKTLENRGEWPLFWIVPNKAQVEQIKLLHPEVQVAYGRHEHECLYYEGENLRADEIPCLTLKDCPHRVNQETGETYLPGSTRCPYYQQKYEAKMGKNGIVVSTVAFYLFTQLFSREWPTPAGLVIDEAHQLASIIRSALSFDITDWHLEQAVELLEYIDAPEAKQLDRFRKAMLRVIKSKPASARSILEAAEIRKLMAELDDVDPKELRRRVGEAVRSGQINPREKREVLKKIEVIVNDIPRYLRSFEYAIPMGDRSALNYVFAYYEKEKVEGKRVQYKLVVKSYYVARLVEKNLLSPRTLAVSATIGDPDIFGFETGVKIPSRSLHSEFPKENTRVFMPTDTPNLALKERSRRDLPKTLRSIARACRKLSRANIRTLVLVVSEDERQRFLRMCEEEKVEVTTYGEGLSAKDAASLFKNGAGMVLVGTMKNYGEGLDLPGGMSGVTFVLRPAYPSPSDPSTVFEERRFGGKRWQLWNWRVMIEALQARGRNVRSADDRGVTFFISQQFRRFVFGSLPEHLRDSYVGDKTFDEGVSEAIKLLRAKDKRRTLPALR